MAQALLRYRSPRWWVSIGVFTVLSPLAFALAFGLGASTNTSSMGEALALFPRAAGLFVVGLFLSGALTGFVLALMGITASAHFVAFRTMQRYAGWLFRFRLLTVLASAGVAAICAWGVWQLMAMIPGLPAWSKAIGEPMRVAVPLGSAIAGAVVAGLPISWWPLSANSQPQPDAPPLGGNKGNAHLTP